MDSSNINKMKKKRTVNKMEWTKEKRKRLRIAGKEYVNAKGSVVAEKQPGPDCKCRRKCYERVPKTTRMKLFKGYYALKSHDEQNAYLFGLIRKVPIARKRAEGSTRRTCTFNYYIRIGGQETQVCVKALANIHGVGKSKIHILCEKLGQNVLFPRDERGRHSKMPKKVTDDTIELVREHIYSIIHTDRAREFLKDEKANNGPDVNITQMHKDFLDTYDPEYAQDFLNYEKSMGNVENNKNNYENCQYINEFRGYPDPEGESEPESRPVQLIMDSEGNAHEVVTPVSAQQGGQPGVRGKKRKYAKDGRPEPLIRQWFYSKIFHELYVNKEAIALRKKILNWKCAEDFISKPMRKQRTPKKTVHQVQHVLVPATGVETELNDLQTLVDQQQQQQQQHQQQQPQQVHLIQARLNKGTNTYIPITTQAVGGKTIQHQIIPLKKKPVQMIQTQGQEMFNIYPMIFQDLSPIDAHTVSLAQPMQQAQLRTIAPLPGSHFQTTGPQPGGTMTITTSNLQTIGVNINLTQGTHYATANGIMSYKFE